MNRSALTPTTVGYALLFAVPPGVGVTGATAIVSGEYALALTAGAVTAVAVFALVVVATASGRAND